MKTPLETPLQAPLEVSLEVCLEVSLEAHLEAPLEAPLQAPWSDAGHRGDPDLGHYRTQAAGGLGGGRWSCQEDGGGRREGEARWTQMKLTDEVEESQFKTRGFFLMPLIRNRNMKKSTGMLAGRRTRKAKS